MVTVRFNGRCNSPTEFRNTGVSVELFKSAQKATMESPEEGTDRTSERSELKGSVIVQSRAAEHFRDGNEAMETSQFEKAVICFSKAITLQPDQTQLCVSQAEAYLQLCDFQSAAAAYQRAWRLEPQVFRDRLAFTYHLQGQSLLDRGLFFQALAAFSRAAEVKPGCRAHEVRSLVCLSAAGLHADALRLVTDWILTDRPTSDLYVLRARLYKQLNQPLKCHQDVKSAMALTPACPQVRALLQQLQDAAERARQKAVDRSLSGQLQDALLMINQALENCPQDPDLYLFRGILHRRLKDFTAAIQDLVQVMELREREEEDQGVRDQMKTPSLQQEARLQLVLTYNDFAVQCFNRRLYAEATLLLSNAIHLQTGQSCVYLHRGDCFFQLADWFLALADYHQAEEMTGSGDRSVGLRLALVYNRLGWLSFQDGCFQEAAAMFSLAISYDPSAGQYYKNRAKAFRRTLNPKGAQRDLICLLILDPTNQELPAMLMSLFPHCSEAQVLSSPLAQAVRVQLMETIEACSSSCNQQRLSEKLQDMSLTSRDAESQSEEASGSEEELKLCLDKQEVFMKSLLQATGRVSENSP